MEWQATLSSQSHTNPYPLERPLVETVQIMADHHVFSFQRDPTSRRSIQAATAIVTLLFLVASLPTTQAETVPPVTVPEPQGIGETADPFCYGGVGQTAFVCFWVPGALFSTNGGPLNTTVSAGGWVSEDLGFCYKYQVGDDWYGECNEGSEDVPEEYMAGLYRCGNSLIDTVQEEEVVQHCVGIER